MNGSRTDNEEFFIIEYFPELTLKAGAELHADISILDLV
jgi:hypothetical protein